MTEDKKRVLVVDCNPDRANMLRELINQRNDLKVVATTFDGEEGLVAARSLNPDLVFSCIGLEGQSGLQLTRAVKAGLPGTAVLIGTVQAGREAEAYAAGADAFVPYPAGSKQIFRSIDAALARSTVGIASADTRRLSAHAGEHGGAIPGPSKDPALRRILDLAGSPGPIILAYFGLAIFYSILGLQDSPNSGLLYGGTFAGLFILYLIAANVRRHFLSDEERKRDDKYHDWVTGQRGRN